MRYRSSLLIKCDVARPQKMEFVKSTRLERCTRRMGMEYTKLSLMQKSVSFEKDHLLIDVYVSLIKNYKSLAVTHNILQPTKVSLLESLSLVLQ